MRWLASILGLDKKPPKFTPQEEITALAVQESQYVAATLVSASHWTKLIVVNDIEIRRENRIWRINLVGSSRVSFYETRYDVIEVIKASFRRAEKSSVH
jgi:hypothetical protein